MNLMSKAGQTTRYTAQDHLTDLIRYLGRPPDVILVNSGAIPATILKRYQSENETPVVYDIDRTGFSGKIILEDFVSKDVAVASTADRLTRSVLRHDPVKLGSVLSTLFL